MKFSTWRNSNGLMVSDPDGRWVPRDEVEAAQRTAIDALKRFSNGSGDDIDFRIEVKPMDDMIFLKEPVVAPAQQERTTCMAALAALRDLVALLKQQTINGMAVEQSTFVNEAIGRAEVVLKQNVVMVPCAEHEIGIECVCDPAYKCGLSPCMITRQR